MATLCACCRELQHTLHCWRWFCSYPPSLAGDSPARGIIFQQWLWERNREKLVTRCAEDPWGSWGEKSKPWLCVHLLLGLLKAGHWMELQTSCPLVTTLACGSGPYTEHVLGVGSSFLLPLHSDTQQLDSLLFHADSCLANRKNIRECGKSNPGAGALQSEGNSGGQDKSSRKLQSPAYLVNSLLSF